MYRLMCWNSDKQARYALVGHMRIQFGKGKSLTKAQVMSRTNQVGKKGSKAKTQPTPPAETNLRHQKKWRNYEEKLNIIVKC
jgi:hypothetical protein